MGVERGYCGGGNEMRDAWRTSICMYYHSRNGFTYVYLMLNYFTLTSQCEMYSSKPLCICKMEFHNVNLFSPGDQNKFL